MTEQQQQHPITPPPALVSQWKDDWHHLKVKHIDFESYIAYRAAQWGADQMTEKQHHKNVQHLQNKIAELEAEVKHLKEELLYCYKGDQ